MPYKQPPLEHRFTSENQPENKGRPKGSLNVKTRVSKLLEMIDEIQGKDNLDAMIIKMIERAKTKGDVSAFNAVLDRLEGKAVQKNEVTGADGEPFILKWQE